MEAVKKILQNLGFSEKESAVYLALLSLGPAPIRKIAEAAQVNRGTTHDTLRRFKEDGLVSYYHQAKRQYFVAEDPSALKRLARKKQTELNNLEERLESAIPQLRSVWSEIEERPVVKYYEGTVGVKTILEDVLNSVGSSIKKEYAVYSSSDIRPYLHVAYPKFSNERIKRGIAVRVIAMGAGGTTVGKDERRWLTKQGGAPTYTLIYAGKFAMISLKRHDAPHGIILEDTAIFETQKILFERTWEMLGEKR